MLRNYLARLVAELRKMVWRTVLGSVETLQQTGHLAFNVYTETTSLSHKTDSQSPTWNKCVTDVSKVRTFFAELSID